MQTPVAQNIGSARFERGDEPIGDSKFAAERHSGRLLHEQRVGTGIDHPAVEAFGQDDAADALRCFQQPNVYAAPLEFVRRRESGDATTDDDNVENIVVHSSMFFLPGSCSCSPHR